MSDVALPNGQVNKWIVDRQPTALDANANGAVRIRKYPTERSSAAVHWSYIGPNVPWQHCHDWKGNEVITGFPSLDDSDENGCVNAYVNSWNDQQYLHHQLVLDWMGWEPLASIQELKNSIAYTERKWVTFRQPSQDDADSDGLVMVVARGEMPVLVDWTVAWNNAGQWGEYYGWTHTDKWHEEALTQNQPSTNLQRLYISVSRSFGPRGQHIIDAVASDGTAWYLETDEGVWYQHPPLPPVQ